MEAYVPKLPSIASSGEYPKSTEDEDAVDSGAIFVPSLLLLCNQLFKVGILKNSEDSLLILPLNLFTETLVLSKEPI